MQSRRIDGGKLEIVAHENALSIRKVKYQPGMGCSTSDLVGVDINWI